MSVKKKTTIASVVIVLLFAAGGWIVWPTITETTDKGYPFVRAKVDIATVEAALRQYESFYNQMPQGDNSAVFRTLMGSNSKGLIFLEVRQTNNVGDLLDPWKTPYKIEFTDKTSFVIKSAGEDQKFNTKDDYEFDSVNRDFIQEPTR